MVRSSGFGSTTIYFPRSFQTRFRFGSEALPLNLAYHRNSPARSTKSTTPHSYGAVSACKHRVSGSLSLPSRGAFHLSLTVLYSIGHMVVFSLMGWSPLLPSGFLVSRRTPDPCRSVSVFAYGAFTLFRLPFQISSADLAFLTQVLYPHGISTVRLGSSNFARHYFQNRFFFLFLRVMRCFSSPGSPRTTIYSSYVTATLLAVSSLIRTSAGQRSFAALRSFSQLVTSFFGAIYQGILLCALCSLIFLDCSRNPSNYLLDTFQKILKL